MPSGTLAKVIQLKAYELTPQIGWSAKILEKPGVPLSNLFVKKFNMLEGCYRGGEALDYQPFNKGITPTV